MLQGDPSSIAWDEGDWRMVTLTRWFLNSCCNVCEGALRFLPAGIFCSISLGLLPRKIRLFFQTPASPVDRRHFSVFMLCLLKPLSNESACWFVGHCSPTLLWAQAESHLEQTGALRTALLPPEPAPLLSQQPSCSLWLVSL